MDIPEYALELLLAYDGRLHYLASGHYLKFEVKAVAKSPRVPHGIAYSLTLHAPDASMKCATISTSPLSAVCRVAPRLLSSSASSRA